MVKTIIIISFFYLGLLSEIFSQDSTYLEVDGRKIKVFNRNATFPEGQDEFYKYLTKAIKYPRRAWKRNVEGEVKVSFVVETDGTVSNYKVIQSLGFGCDEEALRLIKNSPNWIPGAISYDKIDWINVRQRMLQIITFRK